LERILRRGKRDEAASGEVCKISGEKGSKKLQKSAFRLFHRRYIKYYNHIKKEAAIPPPSFIER
jgi:hypothetical protein